MTRVSGMLKNEARPAGSHSAFASKHVEKCALSHSDASELLGQSTLMLSTAAKTTAFASRGGGAGSGARCDCERSTPGTLHGGRAKSSGRDDQRRNAVVIGLGLAPP